LLSKRKTSAVKGFEVQFCRVYCSSYLLISEFHMFDFIENMSHNFQLLATFFMWRIYLLFLIQKVSSQASRQKTHNVYFFSKIRNLMK
jgi:hypothetical protein